MFLIPSPGFDITETTPTRVIPITEYVLWPIYRHKFRHVADWQTAYIASYLLVRKFVHVHEQVRHYLGMVRNAAATHANDDYTNLNCGFLPDTRDKSLLTAYKTPELRLLDLSRPIETRQT